MGVFLFPDLGHSLGHFHASRALPDVRRDRRYCACLRAPAELQVRFERESGSAVSTVRPAIVLHSTMRCRLSSAVPTLKPLRRIRIRTSRMGRRRNRCGGGRAWHRVRTSSACSHQQSLCGPVERRDQGSVAASATGDAAIVPLPVPSSSVRLASLVQGHHAHRRGPSGRRDLRHRDRCWSTSETGARHDNRP
ncbi:hypothetical protein FHR56_001292 [Xanthomonas sacchari]|nr:hypothetical protein [Xanthomonas sp. F10]